MENWYLKNQFVTHKSAIMALSLPEVPQTVQNPVIEEPRDYNTALTMAGVKVRGRIDLRAPPVNGHFFILDWKSCKNFTYCQTPETLARDPQGIIYLQYGFQLYSEARTADFRHIYLRTQEPFGAKAVVTDPMSRDQVQDVFGHLEKTVSEMKTLAAEKDPNQVPFDKTSCSKYGGCPYKNVCPAVERFNPLNLTEFKTMNETQTPNPEMSSLAKKLAERRKASGIINPPDAQVPYEVKPYDPGHAATENMLLAGTTADPVKTFEASNAQVEPLTKAETSGPCTLHEIVVPEAKSEASAQPKFTLCIDTVPNSDNIIDLEYHVTQAVRNAVKTLASSNDLNGKMVLVSSQGLSGLAIDVLSPLANQVFRGR